MHFAEKENTTFIQKRKIVTCPGLYFMFLELLHTVDISAIRLLHGGECLYAKILSTIPM